MEMLVGAHSINKANHNIISNDATHNFLLPSFYTVLKVQSSSFFLIAFNRYWIGKKRTKKKYRGTIIFTVITVFSWVNKNVIYFVSFLFYRRIFFVKSKEKTNFVCLVKTVFNYLIVSSVILLNVSNLNRFIENTINPI